jgi:hypothetical protein
MGDGAGRHRVHQHLEPALSDPTKKVEVLEPEEPFRVGEDAGIEHGPRQQRRPPTGDVDRNELARLSRGRNQILGVRPSADETSPIGDHSPDRFLGRRASILGPADDVGQTRGREGKESNVVLAQIRPLNGWIVESRLDPGAEPTGRTEVARETNQSHAGLQGGVLETPGPVDHNNDPLRGKAFVLNEGTHYCGREPWSSMREDNGRDRQRHRQRTGPV